jgi:hypothetical protein
VILCFIDVYLETMYKALYFSKKNSFHEQESSGFNEDFSPGVGYFIRSISKRNETFFMGHSVRPEYT